MRQIHKGNMYSSIPTKGPQQGQGDLNKGRAQGGERAHGAKGPMGLWGAKGHMGPFSPGCRNNWMVALVSQQRGVASREYHSFESIWQGGGGIPPIGNTFGRGA